MEFIVEIIDLKSLKAEKDQKLIDIAKIAI